MESLKALFKKHRVIALDTCVWIYHFEQNPEFAEITRQILTVVAKGQCLEVTNDQSWSRYPDLTMLCLT